MLSECGADVVNLLFKVVDKVLHVGEGGGGLGREEKVEKSFLGLEAEA